MTDGKMPLHGYPIMRSLDVDDIPRVLGPSVGAQISGWRNGEKPLRIRANRFDLSMTNIWCCAYGAPIKLKFPEVDYFRVQVGYAGLGATAFSDGWVAVTPDQACVSSAPIEIDYGEDFEQLVYRIRAVDIERKLAALIGGGLVRRLQCAPAIDLRTPEGGHLRRGLDFLVRWLDSAGPDVPPLALAELEQALLVSFLCATRHNYSHLLEQPPTAGVARQVRLVEEHIEANWSQPIKIEELAALAGVSARSLFRTFKEQRGCSPMAFAKQIRLREARRLLKSADATTRITDVAFACGFADLGRFSRDYRRAFGELPSRLLNCVKSLPASEQSGDRPGTGSRKAQRRRR